MTILALTTSPARADTVPLHAAGNRDHVATMFEAASGNEVQAKSGISPLGRAVHCFMAGATDAKSTRNIVFLGLAAELAFRFNGLENKGGV